MGGAVGSGQDFVKMTDQIASLRGLQSIRRTIAERTLMADPPMNRGIQHLLAACGREGGMTDGDLLTRFLSGRDDDALTALVRRHGPMVWGVCCRLLRSDQDAEDAFQATFLVLVQKAATLPNRETVGNWLYGVARQTAVRMRAIDAKRGVRERQVAVIPEPATAEQYVWNDLLPVLDEELSRLPNKYRVLIVLCELEGVTRKEVARRLGIPEGTAASRLAAARAMLAKRLTRREIVMSVGLLGSVLSQQSAWASVPTIAVTTTINAATLVAAGRAGTWAISPTVAALTTGVTNAMFMSKIKSALAVVLITALIGGTGLLYTTAAAQGDKKPPAGKPMEPAAKMAEEKVTQTKAKDEPPVKRAEPVKAAAKDVPPKSEILKKWEAIPVPAKTPFDADAAKKADYLVSYRDGYQWSQGIHFSSPTNPNDRNLHAIRGWVEGWQAGVKAGGQSDLPAKYAPYLAWRDDGK
jgi:RNA polymerase sigma factor (sigma-70 family)